MTVNTTRHFRILRMERLVSLLLIASTFGICLGNISPTYKYLISLPELLALENRDLLFSFASFAEKYNKSYPSSEEVIYRVKVFQERVEESRVLNEKSQRHGKNAATYGITKFSDLTLQEFKDKYLMKRMPPIPTEKLPPNHLEPLSSIAKVNGTQPSSFDWATTPGTVTPVYNQGELFFGEENELSQFSRKLWFMLGFLSHREPRISMGSST